MLRTSGDHWSSKLWFTASTALKLGFQRNRRMLSMLAASLSPTDAAIAKNPVL
jgi:hypothetical protein